MMTQATDFLPAVEFTHWGATFRGTELPELMRILRGFTRTACQDKQGKDYKHAAEILRREFNGLWDKIKKNPGQFTRIYDIDESTSALALSLYWARTKIEEAEYGLDVYTEHFGADGRRVFLQSVWGD